MEDKSYLQIQMEHDDLLFALWRPGGILVTNFLFFSFEIKFIYLFIYLFIYFRLSLLIAKQRLKMSEITFWRICAKLSKSQVL